MGRNPHLTTLRNKGVTVEPADGGFLRMRPVEALTDEERAAIRQLKPDLLRLVTPPATPAP